MEQPRAFEQDDAVQDPQDPEVLRLLLQSHARFLDFVERRVGSWDLAEDILQDAFVRSLDHSGSLRNADSAVAWFYRVLRNAIIDHYRRQNTQQRAFDRIAVESSEPAPGVDQELDAVVCACVMALLDTLKPEYAQALRQVDLEGQSVREFGTEVGITAGNAAVRLHRAREALRKQLARSCGTCLTHGCLDCSCQSQGLPTQGAERVE